MQEKFVFPLFLLLFLIGCNSKSSLESVQNILDFHTKSKTYDYSSSADSIIFYLGKAKKSIQLNPSIPDSIKAEHNYLMADLYLKEKLLDSAVVYCNKSISYIDQSNLKDVHQDYFELAWTVNFKLQQYANGISIVNEYIDLLDPNKDADKLLYAFFQLGQLYYELGDAEKELVNYKKALNFAKVAKNEKMTRIITLPIVEIEYPKNKERAFSILDSLSQLNNNDDHTNRSIHHINGMLRYYNNEFYKAIAAYKKSIQFLKMNSESIHFNYDMTSDYCNIAEAYIELKDTIQSKIYLDSASLYLTKDSESSELSFISKLRLSLSLLKGEKATEIHAIFDELVEKQNEKHQEKINEELLALKEANEKEKHLTEQKKEQEIRNLKLQSRNLILGILIVLIISLGFLYYRHRKLTFEKQNLQMQQRLLRSQMNPHFISNILNVIKTTIKKNKEASLLYISKFSKLLRIVLENSTQDYVLLEKELESIRKYLDLQLLRFPKKFTYSLNYKGLKEHDLIYIPPMLMQPFIENSIEHGFRNIDFIGKIEVTLSLNENSKFLECNIIDNGIGFTSPTNNHSESVSIELISSFIYKVTNTKILITDRKTKDIGQSGVNVSFLIPYKFTNHD